MPSWPKSITSTTTAECECCGLTPTLECRTRSGNPALCGYQEYVSASTPPKKYRVQTYNEDKQNCSYIGTGCAADPHGSTHSTVVNATSTYSSTTCGVTNVGTRNFGGSTDSGACVDYTGSLGSSQASGDESDDMTGAPAVTFFTLTTSTATHLLYTGNNTCTDRGGNSNIVRGTSDWALTVEDTESDAIARFQAGTSFGSWLEVGVDCSVPDCCLAQYEPRTSGFSFVYADAQYRVTASGLLANTNYEARVKIYRRTYGSGSYTLYQTAIVSGTTDGSGNFSVTGDVPNDRGYDTYAGSALIFLA
jgi:hypothetical protein